MGAVPRNRRMCEELGGKRNSSFWCGIPGKCTLVLSFDSPRRFGASFVRYNDCWREYFRNVCSFTMSIASLVTILREP